MHLATRTIVKPKPWASWAPVETTPEGKVRDIADYVQNLYVAPGGKNLTTVRGGPLSVGSDPAVLVKPDAKATATGGYKFFDGAVGRVPALRQHDQGQLHDRPEEDHSEPSPAHSPAAWPTSSR